MFIDDEAFRADLDRQLARISPDYETREDLRQVALVRISELELANPGQTRSWFLQSAIYHAFNWLRLGRSVDSIKRSGGRRGLTDEPDPTDPDSFVIEPDGATVESLSADDSARVLSEHLERRDRCILAYFLNGYGAAQVARKLRISHQAVSKHRKLIARAAAQLGILPSNPPRALPQSHRGE